MMMMMMELYEQPSGRLDAYIANHLLPSEEFSRNVREAVHRICDFLKTKCSMEARVIKTVKGGSAGKGTTLEDNSDADLVIFLSCFSSYKDQAEKRGSVINTIEQNLKRCCGSIAFQVDIHSPRTKGSPPRSLSLTIQTKKKKEAVEVDILPAYDVLGQITEIFKPHPQVYRDLIEAGGKPGEFNASFTELQRNFVKCRPVKVKGLLRLVKHWYKECKKNLREANPSLSLPPKFALELLTIYAWEEGTDRAEQFNTAEGFCTVMKLIGQFQHLCLYWTEYYDLEDSVIGPYVIEKLKGPRPVIMDPADPTGNVAGGNGWDQLAKEAFNCQNQPCCKKLDQPVKSWNVQPARNFEVTEMEICVRDHNNRSSVYAISPSQSVWDLKKKIEARINIFATQQRLLYNDKELNDTNTLASYNIRSKDTVYLLLRLRGGHLSLGTTSL
ncbi:hypothetical protein JRQ81_002833 [Phrynocephalus forsythii]|uniref:Ubiquitin-like domain-containing protein n=1 Tax=Phrynocephalus forsythii TaxID=171643 RepID=A0A9Q0XJD1_9SAUR|nr:hypothetical protein JRQ81_002833 [Phrynocephalus forsythii]